MQQLVLDITTEPRHLEARRTRWMGIAAVVAVVGIAASLALAMATPDGVHYLLETYLVSYALFLSLSLGALFFVMLQHVTRAGWSVVVRRIAEAMATNVWLMAVLAIPIVLGMEHLYHWAHPGAADHDPLIAAKVGFLNPGFFIARLVVYFAIWSVLAWFFYRTSTAQDASGDPALSRRMEVLSAPGIVLFALSLNFAAFDLLMSLDPHWFSTIYGVYYFAASVLLFFAVMPKILLGLQSRGLLERAVTVEHYHDVGKFMFAFTVFWAYIAFSQYMLIWYGNIPEETQWYLKRQTGDWTWVSLALLFGHFVLPFLLLISRHVKRRPLLLAVIGVFVAIMSWVDMYWLVIPEFSPGVARFGLLDVLVYVGLAGLYSTVLIWRLGRTSLVPEKDPRLVESLAFENA
ncbi:MAG TPA: hypothetical protein VLT32_02620 [Candidatus Sulfomarinibacteraceae bacterium]|nr:hypothetical protein [Candidatus Sulfomarinibacteraceae bacterium]